MTRTITALLVLLFAAAASADVIRFVPPAPDNTDSVKVDIGGQWYSSCSPTNPRVTMTADRVDVFFTQLGVGGGCLTAVLPWVQRVNLGVLPAGVYTLAASAPFEDHVVDLGQATLIVRGRTPLATSVFGAPVSGGEQISIVAQQPLDLSGVTAVRLGGVAANVVHADPHSLTVNVPPHPAGPVDLEVDGVGGTTIHEEAAFIYFDPNEPANPFVHEPLLFPLSYGGAGAFGSMWSVESWIDARKSPVAFKNTLPCDGCGTTASPAVSLRTEPIGTGYLLYAIRADETPASVPWRFEASSRVKRAADDLGTEVPVVRESEFRYGTFTLLNIPVIQNARALLRLYATAPTGCAVSLPGGFHSVSLTQVAIDRPFFGSIDVTSDLNRPVPDAPRSATVTCGQTTPAWAMLTITDNTTQHVTVISPQ